MLLYALVMIVSLVDLAKCTDYTAPLEVELGSYKSDLQEVRSHLDKLKEEGLVFNSVLDTFLIPNQNVKELNEVFAALNQSVNEHHDKVLELYTKYNACNKTLSETVYRQEQQVEKLEPKLADLEIQIQYQSSNLTQLTQDLTDVESQVTNRSNDIQNYDRKYSSLENKIENQEKALQVAVQRTSELVAEVDNEKANSEFLASVIERMNSDFATLDEQVSKLVSELNLLKTAAPRTVSSRICTGWNKRNP